MNSYNATIRDEWLCGYAAGLAASWHVSHDVSVVKHAMHGDGITIKHLEKAGVESFDLRIIEKCMK